MSLPITPDMLLQYGIIGIVLAWFMFRTDKKLDAIPKAINDLKDQFTLLNDELRRMRATAH